jgi:hypothetical protein
MRAISMAPPLMLMIITIALLVTPESYHQIVDVGRDTERFHQLISRTAAVALLPFALGLGIALFIAGERVFDFVPGLATGCVVAGLTFGGWFAFEYLRRLQTGHQEQAISARQQTMMENTLLDHRITQMLTEAGGTARSAGAARLPAISVISQSFEKLPVSSKMVHAASLGYITQAWHQPPPTASFSRSKIPRRSTASEAGSSPVRPCLWPWGWRATSMSSSL